MAWTAPMTAVANTALTAAQWNAHVRDNLLETAPAKAVNPGGYFVTTASNAIAERQVSNDFISTTQTTSSTSYTDLGTFGPTVTLTTGPKAIVSIAASMSMASDNAAGLLSFAVSGATTIAASDNWAAVSDGVTNGNFNRIGVTHLVAGLNPGGNTFTMKYRAGSAATTFQLREIVVQAY
jgi:hypothetical protein